MGSCILNYLTVGCWNIEGIYEKVKGIKLYKLDDTTFQNTLNKFDVLCLQETHIPSDEIIPSIKIFSIIPHCRAISDNNRHFGGMLIFVRNFIKKGIIIGNKSDQDALELILKKTFFGLREDVKILYTYASPINSCYTKSRPVNIFDKLETIFLDSNQNHVVMGDLNGKTKGEDDFVRDNFDKHSPINTSYYEKGLHMHAMRSNRDTHPVDEQGTEILL